jgi:hypothetical protein
MGARVRWCLDKRPAILLALLYMLVAMPLSLSFCVKTPMLDVPDEANHLLRAIQVGQGGFFGVRYPGNFVGGQLPSSAIQATGFVDCYLFRPGIRITPAMLAPYRALRWRSPPQAAEFPNTAIYPPWFYVASATAIDIGRTLDLPIMTSFRLSRFANAITAVLIGALAIGLADTGAPILAVLLALPMTLFLFGSASQDSLMIASAALAAAILTRQSLGADSSWSGWIASGLLLGALGAARAPYILLSLLPALFAWPRPDRIRGLAATALAFTVALLWLVCSVIPLSTPTKAGGGLVSGAQMHWVLQHPIAAATVLFRSFADEGGDMFQQFIGVLSWLDIRLPDKAYRACEWALSATLVTSVSWPKQLRPRHAAIVLLLLAVAAGTEMAIFLSWDAIGSDVILGVQGRYFLPLSMFLCLIGRRPGIVAVEIGAVALIVIVFMGDVAALHAVATRYPQ